ncbi:PLP-dependent aminotransferase family protein [Loktanella sp. D2R18]|uniref:aminotransferase-like domain-containing protein n=1 Tax=Rhodobacterales TaxID=204455 RepID=UPI000DEBBB61|nr:MULTISPECIES: PLP-dependent aminotransferase family protein [Rhodobacterales]MDO6591597.1 PLP-dependent aminotransferase family protein [Yoonia sp. 1_MG-2023]RBW43713.1 PLP-dependent aminotransferase family protein [Loktanella sp. D2R18]
MIVTDTIWQPTLAGAGRSKYQALAHAIREGITSGQLAEGEKLPPVRDLAYRVSVTPGTVARAYKLLIDETLLEAGVGRGTFVAKAKPTPVRSLPSADRFFDPALDRDGQAHLLSPKMPDVGQADMIREAMHMLADTTSPDMFLRYPTRDTDLPAREAFAATLDPEQVGAFDIHNIVTSHGGQNAIVMILQSVLTGANPVIAVDELSYGGFRSAGVLCRAEVVGIPWDDDGPLVSALETAIKTHKIQAFCTSAEVSNPTAKQTTPERRSQIAALAQAHGMHIIDDDCYRLMNTRRIGPSYRALLPGLGWYLTSPSKSITASLRIGFTVAPKGWSKALTRTATFSSFGVTRMVTDLYATIMNHAEIDAIVERVKDRISDDISAAVRILDGYEMRYAGNVPFLWLELPIGWRAGEFCQAAEAAGILIKSADDFALRESRSVHAVRIAVNGLVPHAHFLQAMECLRDLLDHPPERIAI